MFRVALALALGVWLLPSQEANATARPELFREIECWVDPEFIALNFVHDGDNPKSISFAKDGAIVDSGDFFAVAVDWKHILSVQIEPARQNPKLALFAVEFDPYPNLKPSPLVFGMIDRSCAARLKAQYGAYTKFRESVGGNAI